MSNFPSQASPTQTAEKPPCPDRERRRQIERAVARVVVSFYKDFQGRGPDNVRVHLLGDMVVVRMGEVLTPLERSLAAHGECPQAVQKIRDLRRDVQACGGPQLRDSLAEVLGADILDILCDTSVACDENVLVLLLERPVSSVIPPPAGAEPGAPPPKGEKGREKI